MILKINNSVHSRITWKTSKPCLKGSITFERINLVKFLITVKVTNVRGEMVPIKDSIYRLNQSIIVTEL